MFRINDNYPINPEELASSSTNSTPDFLSHDLVSSSTNSTPDFLISSSDRPQISPRVARQARDAMSFPEDRRNYCRIYNEDEDRCNKSQYCTFHEDTCKSKYGFSDLARNAYIRTTGAVQSAAQSAARKTFRRGAESKL